jgi:hypothetical protein
MNMGNLVKAGFAVLVSGMLMMSACSSDKPSGTGGSSGTGGVTGTGGAADAGSDAPTGAGGAAGAAGSAGTGGAGGAAPSTHQDHLNIINKATAGGITVTRPAPLSYDTCKI